MTTTKIGPSVLTPNPRQPMVDPKTGLMTTYTLQMLQQIVSTINGLSLIIPCTAVFHTNKYTLTPFSVAPNVPDYFDYWTFAFVAPTTSTGTISAEVIADNSTLGVLPVIRPNGATAGAGDISINVQYFLTFEANSNLFVLR